LAIAAFAVIAVVLTTAPALATNAGRWGIVVP
jgi:hypothetical protein